MSNVSELLTPSNITFCLWLLGVIFSVYNSFKNPQEEIDKKHALVEQKMTLEKQNTDSRLAEMTVNWKESLTLATNHVHTLDIKMDNIQATLSLLQSEIVRQNTIIEERMPRKT